ncbi:hypothetical protein BH23GEM2_BH23GEM2_16340 [soil metagenome]
MSTGGEKEGGNPLKIGRRRTRAWEEWVAAGGRNPHQRRPRRSYRTVNTSVRAGVPLIRISTLYLPAGHPFGFAM